MDSSFIPSFQEFLLILGRLEKKAEVKRNRLCSLPEFEPYTIFRLLDTDDKKYIDIEDIHVFLQQNDFDFDSLPGGEMQVVEQLIHEYDADQDGVLNYDDFLALVLPRDNPALRSQVSQRRHSKQHYHQNVELAMLDLLRSEMGNVVEINQLKGQFQVRDLERVFSEMDRQDNQQVSCEDLEAFFSEYEHYLYAQEIQTILTRLSGQQVGSITRHTFLSFMAPYVCFSRQPTQTKQWHQAPSHDKTQYQNNYMDYMINKMSNKPVSKKESTLKSSLKKNQSRKIQEFRLTSNRQQVEDAPSASRRMVSEESSGVSEVDYVLDQLVKMLQMEREVERTKQELALRPDFNLIDFFILLDKNQKGYLFFQELLDFLASSGTPSLSATHIQLFYERFSEEEVQMKFSQFATAFTPQHIEYADILNNRKPARLIKPGSFSNFTKGTQKIVQRIFEQYQENEWELEEMRQNIDERQIDLRQVYHLLDPSHSNSLDIRDILEEHTGRRCSDKDIGYLVSRFDRGAGGNIREQHFMETLVPRGAK